MEGGSIAKNTEKNSLDLQAHVEMEIRREKERTKRKVISAMILLAGVYVVAIGVFHTLEGWSWEDSIYFTTATITTVGYGDLVPHTYFGRLFTVPLMLVGVGVGLYVIYTIQDYGRSKLDSVAKEVELLEKRIRNHGRRK